MNYWERFIASLKINRCPILNRDQQAKLEQQAKLNRLYPKKP
jgi:hypothetical protein